MGHLFDAVAFFVPLLAFGLVADAVISARIAVLFTVVGTLLLWPTHRRGRQSVAASEGLLSIVTRIGLSQRPVHCNGHVPLADELTSFGARASMAIFPSPLATA